MVARKPNLLEAFRAAAPESRDAQKRASTPPAAAGGPFAAAKPASEQGAPQLKFFESARKTFVQRMLGDRAVQLTLLLALVAVGAAFLFGRDKKDAQAGDAGGAVADSAGAAPSAAVAPAVTPAATETTRVPPPATATEHDRAFYDTANKYTVRVAQYNNDDVGLKAARAAVAYLAKEGYPAVQPIQSGDGGALIACVGASPKAKDLDVLIAYLKELRGPPPQPKKPPFRDAYVVRIDDVLRRQ